jgi:hypothetical protein
VLTGFLFIFGPIFLWVLSNNDSHVYRQWQVRTGTAPPSDWALKDDHGLRRIAKLPERVGLLIHDVRHPCGNRETAADEGGEFVRRLAGHTAVQNITAIGMAMLTVIGVVGAGIGLNGDASAPNSEL